MKNKNLNLLLNPLYLLALLILILNDHFLKANYPSFLTGKLSDFSGIFMFTVFIYVLIKSYIKYNYQLILLHIVVAISFVIWKIAPVEIILSKISELTSLPVPFRVKDPTDLIALSILFLSYWFILKFKNKTATLYFPAVKNILLVMIVAISGWSIMATSVPISPESLCCVESRGNVDNSVDDIVNISDALYLTEYINSNGPRPVCLKEGDVNGSGDKNLINKLDLEYLINYIFYYGPSPILCNEYME